MIVVRIEHLHDISRQILLLHRFLVIALVEGIQLEAVHRLRIPDTQGIHDAVTIAYHRHIVRNRCHGLIPFLPEMVSAVLVHIDVDVTAEAYLLRVFGSSQFKGIAVAQPVIRHLHLIAVPDLLLKHAITIPDTAAVCRIAQCCQRIQKAGRQTS